MGDSRILGTAIQEVATYSGGHYSQHAPASYPDGVGGADARRVADAFHQELESAKRESRVTWRLILSEQIMAAFAAEDPRELRARLVQVGSLAISWVADLDVRKKAGR